MRLIDADVLISDIESYSYPSVTGLMARIFKNIINNQKTVPFVKEGRWIVDKGVGFECSECWRVNKKPTLYCPACGSRNRISDGYVK